MKESIILPFEGKGIVLEEVVGWRFRARLDEVKGV